MRFFDQHPKIHVVLAFLFTIAKLAIEIAFLVTGLPVLPQLSIMLDRFIDLSANNTSTRSLNCD